MLVELIDLSSDLIEVGLDLGAAFISSPVEQVLNEAPFVDVQDVFVLLVLFEELERGDLVLFEHGLDLSLGILNPDKVGAEVKAASIG